MCIEREQWEAHLFLQRHEDIETVAEDGDLWGSMREDEKLVYLFPSTLAPPPARPIV